MKKGQRKQIRKKPSPYFERDRKKWVARVLMADGKYRTQRFDTKTEARDAIEDLWGRRDQAADASTVQGAVDQWIAAGKHWKAKTRQSYLDTVKFFEPIADIPLDRLRPNHIQQMLDVIESAAMRKRARRYLSTCLNWCVGRRMISANPAKKTEAVKHAKRKVEVFTSDEVQRILDATPAEWKPAILILYQLSIRPGELWGLEWSDIDGDRLTIQRSTKEVGGDVITESPKTAAGIRTLPLPPQVAEALAGMQKSAGRIFNDSAGGPMRHGNFRQRIWRPTLEAAGVPYKPIYTLRHTSATMMLNSGRVSLAAVSRWLGHADITTTLRNYSHLMTGELEIVARFWD